MARWVHRLSLYIQVSMLRRHVFLNVGFKFCSLNVSIATFTPEVTLNGWLCRLFIQYTYLGLIPRPFWGYYIQFTVMSSFSMSVCRWNPVWWSTKWWDSDSAPCSDSDTQHPRHLWYHHDYCLPHLQFCLSWEKVSIILTDLWPPMLWIFVVHGENICLFSLALMTTKTLAKKLPLSSWYWFIMDAFIYL